ncbi:nfx1-type zinc finger-containing protein [Fusarium circinatum]|uniref:Nfx1-type zinc finger-containing protein n=1 Tax=Fusarium circinatum TaxID=48490 RepID=A0A8H5T4Y3_FUSCI|nr:nfx1-type zinc finger-containing protein [Fusarium circinatum]
MLPSGSRRYNRSRYKPDKRNHKGQAPRSVPRVSLAAESLSFQPSGLPPSDTESNDTVPEDGYFRRNKLKDLAKESVAVRDWLVAREIEARMSVKAIMDDLMALDGYEFVKSNCLSLLKNGPDKQDVQNVLFAGNPGLYIEKMAKLYARLIEALVGFEFSWVVEKLGQSFQPDSEVNYLLNMSKADDVPCQIILIEEVCSNWSGIQALEKVFDASKSRHVHIVACCTWTSDTEKKEFLQSFQKISRTGTIFYVPDYTREQLKVLLLEHIRESGMDIEDGLQSHNLKMVVDIITREQGHPGFKNQLILKSAVSSFKENYERRTKTILVHKAKDPSPVSSSREDGAPSSMSDDSDSDDDLEKRYLSLISKRQLYGWGLQSRERVRSHKREPSPAHWFLTYADIFGRTAAEYKSHSSGWQKLHKLIGLQDIKSSIGLYFKESEYHQHRALQGRESHHRAPNQVFIGPPGTGKTTVAILFAEILAEIGLLAKKKVVVKQPTDLIGQYLGSSEAKVKEAVKESLGGVLVLDKADNLFLTSGSLKSELKVDVFRIAIMDALVAEYQRCERNPSSKRLTVFLIGSQEGIEDLIRTGNPGLSGLFHLEGAFRFQPYLDDHLCQLVKYHLAEKGVTASAEATETIMQMITIAKHRPNFTNATAAQGFAEDALMRYRARLLSEDSQNPYTVDRNALVEPKDFDPDHDRLERAHGRFNTLFSGMQGVEYITEIFQGYQTLVSQLRKRKQDPRPYIPLSFVFKGPPGTGKTTVARKVADIFYEMGFLSYPDMIDCSVEQLVSGPGRVEEIFERALGKVLFIGEAYLLLRIRGGAFIGEFVDCMTKTRFSGKLIVVLAGYEEEMSDLLMANRGLASRFPTSITFQRMKPTDSIALLSELVGKVGVEISGLEPTDYMRGQVVRLLSLLAKTKSWANGRDVESLSQQVIHHAFTKVIHKCQPTRGRVTVVAEDVMLMLATRLARAKEEDVRMKVAQDMEIEQRRLVEE